MKNATLDMRMNPEEGETAAQILRRSSRERIEAILKDGGEERLTLLVPCHCARCAELDELASAEEADFQDECLGTSKIYQQRVSPIYPLPFRRPLLSRPPPGVCRV